MKSVILVSVLAFSACGLPGAKSQSPASQLKDETATSESLCAAWGRHENLSAFKIVKPFSEAVSDLEKAMIQVAVMQTDSSTPVTPDQAVDIFADRDNGGSLAGEVSYFKMRHGRGEKTLALATYYPGDNEYGALFQVWTFENGTQQVGMIGTIGDSDLYCLTPQSR